MNRRFITLVAVFVVLLGSFVLYLQYRTSYVDIHIDLDNEGQSLRAALYRQSDETESLDTAKAKVTLDIPSSGNYRVKKGSYWLVSRANQTFAATQELINVGSKGKNFTVKPDYSERKNNELLGMERLSILQALTTKYPAISQQFTIATGKLYHRGEWYATQLISNSLDDSNNDTLKAVLQKNNGAWGLVTSPPDIFISRIKYPDIPRDLLIDINR